MAVQETQLADIREMYMAHTMFRREFGLMPALVREVADGDRERAGIVADHIELITSVLEHHHHAEDVHLWPRLLQRAPEQAGAVARTMEEQHEAIHELNTEREAAVEAWRVTGAATAGAALAEILGRLVAALGEHLEAEERLALPLVEAYVTADEWVNMTQSAMGDVPQESMPLMFGLMIYEGDPKLIDEILAGMPGDMGALLKPAAVAAFAEHAQQVYGTATPPRVTV
jgi:hemerythrin-like domain-containing protein